MGVVLYGLAKFMAYTAFAHYGQWRALASTEAFPPPPRLRVSLALGVLRWFLGLFLGTVLFFAVRPSAEEVWATYVAVYVPVRIVEWGIIAALLMARGQPSPQRDHARYWLGWLGWVLLGVVVSFATDMVSPDMVKEGRFCVGRCLC